MEHPRREQTCCFTGHRPEKLHQSEAIIAAALEEKIRHAIKVGYRCFITGMACGTDIWAAESVIRAKNEKQDIVLVCAIPYRGFERRWSFDWQKRFNAIVAIADQVEYICTHHSRACYQIRNVWMVDRSSLVIAVYNGQAGGTRNTLQYAHRCGIDCSIIRDGDEYNE